MPPPHGAPCGGSGLHGYHGPAGSQWVGEGAGPILNKHSKGEKVLFASVRNQKASIPEPPDWEYSSGTIDPVPTRYNRSGMHASPAPFHPKGNVLAGVGGLLDFRILPLAVLLEENLEGALRGLRHLETLT